MAQGPLGIVAGSGIDVTALLDEVHWRKPFDAFEGLGASTVPGHASCFVGGAVPGHRVVVQQGRLHPYEGLDLATVTRTVDVLYACGIRRIVFTNAVGALADGLEAGDLVAADEVLTWPYPRYNLPETMRPAFTVPGCEGGGRYVWVHGPCYETRAEVAALRKLGGAAVGMSTAPELYRCQQLGIDAAIVSCVTNVCGAPGPLNHNDVVSTAQAASQKLCTLLREFLGQ